MSQRTRHEHEMFRLLCLSEARAENYNPDVGMGVSPETIIERILERTGIDRRTFGDMFELLLVTEIRETLR